MVLLKHCQAFKPALSCPTLIDQDAACNVSTGIHVRMTPVHCFQLVVRGANHTGRKIGSFFWVGGWVNNFLNWCVCGQSR